MKSHNYLYILLFAAIIAGGCKVSKDIAKPADAVPAAFRDAPSTDTVSVATLGLKEFISEPDIQKLIDTALAKNYDLQLAVKNIEASELLFKQSRLGNLPAINLQVTAN